MIFTESEVKKFKKRLEEGYELTSDCRLQMWLQETHPNYALTICNKHRRLSAPQGFQHVNKDDKMQKGTSEEIKKSQESEHQKIERKQRKKIPTAKMQAYEETLNEKQMTST